MQMANTDGTWSAHKPMRFTAFRSALIAAYPTGEAMQFQDGSIGVRFEAGGKLFHYRSYGIRALAEHLKIA